jgi:hypothetical protein
MVFSYRCCEVLLSAIQTNMPVSCEGVNFYGGCCSGSLLKRENDLIASQESLIYDSI